MTRGRYGASAAKRRAESAEEQLDRLIPQLTDAKRTAARYKSEAERVPSLLRQLAELKDRVGVPMDDHLAIIRQVEQERDDILDAYDNAVKYIFIRLATAGVIEKDTDAGHIDADFILALACLPDDVTEYLLTHLGWDRELRKRARTPAGAQKIYEMDHGRKEGKGDRLRIVEGQLGRDMVKFLSARADARAAASAEARAAADGD